MDDFQFFILIDGDYVSIPLHTFLCSEDYDAIALFIQGYRFGKEKLIKKEK